MCYSCFAIHLLHFHYVSVCLHALLRRQPTAAHHSIEYQYQISTVTRLPVCYLGEGSEEFNNLHKHPTFCRKCSEMNLSSVSSLVFTYSLGQGNGSYMLGYINLFPSVTIKCFDQYPRQYFCVLKTNVTQEYTYVCLYFCIPCNVQGGSIWMYGCMEIRRFVIINNATENIMFVTEQRALYNV